MIPVPKLGWMAGVVDLKGRLIYKTNQQRATTQVVLFVETKEYAIVRELGSLTGTKPELMKAQPMKDFMRKGCADHCPEPHVHVNDSGAAGMMPATARWTITGAGMVVVLHNLIPFLMVDRGYAEAVEMVQSVTALTGQGSGMVMTSLRRLSLIGWDLPEEYAVALKAYDKREPAA